MVREPKLPPEYRGLKDPKDELDAHAAPQLGEGFRPSFLTSPQSWWLIAVVLLLLVGIAGIYLAL